ncbi:MAG: glycosyltransferase family 4 protein [Amphiplicatus sp.]
MKLAYLMNTYPLVSTTFIRREIEAHEAAGVSVTRYALRPWKDDLVDPSDIAEKDRVHYILVGNLRGLAAAFFAEFFTRPVAVLRGLLAAAGLWRNARGGLVRHKAYFFEAVYLLRRARADGIDHIHAHFGTNAAAVAMLVRIMGGPAYSFTAHGPDELFDAPLLSFPDKIRHAAFVAAISHYARAQLIRIAGAAAAEKIRVIRCGLPLDEFAPAPPPPNQTFVCIGRLCPQKGQALIPAALARVRRDFPDARVILVGDGEARAAIEAAARAEGVAEAIDFAGWKSNRDAMALLAGARALLLPTFAEGLPVVLMEAFALGRPVVSTFIAGIPELLDAQCGWIVPAGDEDALAEAMADAFGASEAVLAAKGREGRARVEARHDLQKNAAALRGLFEVAENRL